MPGYIMLAFIYFFPTEWGKSRNTTMGARMWQFKGCFAPILSIIFYTILFFVLATNQKISTITESIEAQQQSTAASAPEISPIKLENETNPGVIGDETKNSTVPVMINEETVSKNPKNPTEANSLIKSEESVDSISGQSKIDAKSMWELEEAVQYHGHNPETRKRLGLPPKEIGPKK